MAELKELYTRMEKERLAVIDARKGERESRFSRETEYLSSSRMHIADVRKMSDRDFRYMEVLESVFSGAIELISEEKWQTARRTVGMEDIVLCENRYGDVCLTARDPGWFKCAGTDEVTGVKVDELVFCAMPEMEFAGYFTSPEELTQREKRNLTNLVLDPGNEQLARVCSNLSGSNEYAVLPYRNGADGEVCGELVIFRDGHVFDSERGRWFADFKKDHFAPDSMDAARLSVMIALDINYPEVQ